MSDRLARLRTGPAECRTCGEKIKENEYRIVVAISECGRSKLPSRPGWAAITFCEDCSSPFIGLLPKDANVEKEFLLEVEQEIQSENQKHDKTLRSAVKTGDTKKIDKMLPVYAPDEDVMARAVTVKSLETLPPDPDMVPARSVVGVGTLAGSTGSLHGGEAGQRERVLKFLNVPASRGMRTEMREAAKLWAHGASQNEVARKMGKDQSTVSRMIAGAKKMAYEKG